MPGVHNTESAFKGGREEGRTGMLVIPVIHKMQLTFRCAMRLKVKLVGRLTGKAFDANVRYSVAMSTRRHDARWMTSHKSQTIVTI